MESASIAVSESFDIAAPIDVVWRQLNDPSAVVGCVPGAELTGEGPDGALLGAITMSLGPTTVRFGGQVTPTYDADQREGQVVALGSDKGGRSRARAKMVFRLESVSETNTRVVADGTIDVSGGLAGFLRTGGTHIAKRLVADFAQSFTELCVSLTNSATPTAEAARSSTATKPLGGFRLVLGVTGDVVRAWFGRIFRRRPSDH